MSRKLIVSIAGVAIVLSAIGAGAPHAPIVSADAGKGMLFFNGGIVRTVVPPAAFPRQGTDPFFEVTNGVGGQLGIAGAAPGSAGYKGGHWAVSAVTFRAGVTPYLLKSAAEVQTAQTAGDVTVTRTPAADFLCPVQP